MPDAELKLQIDAHLLEQARAANLSLAVLLETALKAALGPEAAEERARRWAEENADAIKAYNERIKREGCFGEDLRTW